MKIVSLKAFPSTNLADEAKNFQVSAGAQISTSNIELRYQVSGLTAEAFAQVILPKGSAKPERKEKLWEGTCFECFIPSLGISDYLEFNGAPCGDWNWYSFKNYRIGMEVISLTQAEEPKMISMKLTSLSLELTWSLPLSGVARGFSSRSEILPKLEPLGLSVILKTKPQTLYWALFHDGAKPDFHSRASFNYDPFRN